MRFISNRGSLEYDHLYSYIQKTQEKNYHGNGKNIEIRPHWKN